MTILYEDDCLIVVEKPVGIESQSTRGFEPDMVSEIKKHINNFCTVNKEPYVGVIHRLDKPVSGVMVYAKTPETAAALSTQIQKKSMRKIYLAVACGKLVDSVGNYVDYLLKDGKSNCSRIVDKGITGAKLSELKYRVLGERECKDGPVSLVEVELLTGRHHQIRVQFAGHGNPLWGDQKYNPLFQDKLPHSKTNVALCAGKLSFYHPKTKKLMNFNIEPKQIIFKEFK